MICPHCNGLGQRWKKLLPGSGNGGPAATAKDADSFSGGDDESRRVIASSGVFESCFVELIPPRIAAAK